MKSIFFNREVKDGSVLTFGDTIFDETVIGFSELSEHEKKILVKLNQHANSTETNSLSYLDIQLFLNIERNSVRRLVKKFTDVGLFISTDVHHPKHKSVKQYIFNHAKEPVLPIKKSFSSDLILPGKFNSAYNLAASYNRPVDLSTEDFLSIPDTVLIKAIFSEISALHPNDTLQEESSFDSLSFSDILPPKSFRLLSQDSSYQYPINSVENIELAIELTSPIGVIACIDDLQFIYTIINLTLRYHIDRLNNNIESGQYTVTPIKVQDVLTFLGLNQYATANKRAIFEKIKIWANTNFSLVGYTDNIIGTFDKPIFSIRATSSYSYKEKKGRIPNKVFLQWDLEVLKEIFRAKKYFILPNEVISGDKRLFLLYLYVRRFYSYKNSLTLNVSLLRRILSVSSDISPKSFERSLHNLFRNTYNSQNIKPYTTENKKDHIEIPIVVAAVRFTLFIQKNHVNSWKEISMLVEFDRESVFIAAQPPALRNKLLSLNDEDRAAYISENLTTRSKTHPVIHNNSINLSSLATNIDMYQKLQESQLTEELDNGPRANLSLIDSYQENKIQAAQYLAPETNEEAIVSTLLEKKIKTYRNLKILKRKHSLDIRLEFSVNKSSDSNTSIEKETARYKIHKYMELKEISGYVDDIHAIADYNKEKTLKKIQEALKSIKPITVNGNELNEHQFQAIVDYCALKSGDKFISSTLDIFEVLVDMGKGQAELNLEIDSDEYKELAFSKYHQRQLNQN